LRTTSSGICRPRAGETEDLFAALCQATTEDGERFSDEDVVNHMIFLMMAAHDTSTITTTAVTYFLASIRSGRRLRLRKPRPS
jgi:cytochrome P450